MNSIREIMTLHGYRFKSQCNCDGYKTEKYRKDDYEFRWRVNAYKFSVKLDGRTIKSWTSVKEAEEYLNKIHEVKEIV